MNIVSKNITYHEKVVYVANSTLLLVLLFLSIYEIAKLSFIRIVSIGFYLILFQMLFEKN